MLDWSKMVSRKCRLQSMVVQERNYIEWTNGDTTVNTSDIREEYLFHITSSEFFLLQEKPMGAVSVFMVGNYLNQPSEMDSSVLGVVASLVFFKWDVSIDFASFFSNLIWRHFSRWAWCDVNRCFGNQQGLSTIERRWIGVALVRWGAGELHQGPDDRRRVLDPWRPSRIR